MEAANSTWRCLEPHPDLKTLTCDCGRIPHVLAMDSKERVRMRCIIMMREYLEACLQFALCGDQRV